MTEQEQRKQVNKRYGNGVEVRTAEVRASDSDGMVIEGYAAVFDQVTNIGPFQEVIDRGAFEGHLNDDVRLYLNHDGPPMARTVNNTLTLSTDDHGLKYRATLVDTQGARDLYETIKRGDISQSSFAFTIEKEERQSDGVRRVMQVGSILDVSPVSVAAYPTTNVAVRSALFTDDAETVERKTTEPMDRDLNLKDLLSLRAEYAEKRNTIKATAAKEDRDLTESDVIELERLADEVGKYDLQIKVKREDQKLEASAILAGGNTASRSEQNELNKLGARFDLMRGVQQVYRGRALTGVEAEMTEEAGREAKAAGVTFRGQLSLPGKLLQRAGDAGDFQAGSGDGSEFVGTQVGPAVEALRAENTLEQAGITVLNGLTSDLRIPKMATGANIAVKGEGVAAVTSGQELASVTLSPRRATAFTLVTEQLMIQGGAAVESLVFRDMADAVRAEIERLCFIDLFDSLSGAAHIETALDAAGTVEKAIEAQLLSSGVNRAAIRFIADFTAHQTVTGGVEVAGVSPVVDRAAGTALGYPYLVGGNMPKVNATAPVTEYQNGLVLAGDFSRGAALGYFGGVDVVINPYVLDLENQVRISIHRHFDCAALQAGALVGRYDDGEA